MKCIICFLYLLMGCHVFGSIYNDEFLLVMLKNVSIIYQVDLMYNFRTNQPYSTGATLIGDVLFNYDDKYILWTDMDADNPHIGGVFINGTQFVVAQIPDDYVPKYVAYEPSSNLLFYSAYDGINSSDPDKIGVINKQGVHTTIINTGVQKDYLLLDSQKGYLFFISYEVDVSKSGVYRMTMNGLDTNHIIDWGNITGIYLDRQEEVLLVSDISTNIIYACDYDGLNCVTNYSRGSEIFHHIAIARGEFYFSSTGVFNRHIYKTPFDGSNWEYTYVGDRDSYIHAWTMDPYIAGSTDQVPKHAACSVNNGGCTDFCFPTPSGYTCGAAKCPELIATANATVTETRTCHRLGGNTCPYMCEYNFLPKHPSVDCTWDEVTGNSGELIWDLDALEKPLCIEQPCPNRVVANGQFDVACSGYRGDDCLNFTCNPSYGRNPDVLSLRCIHDFTWEHPLGTLCLGTCPVLGGGAVLNSTCKRLVSGLCSYSCPVGYMPRHDQIWCGTDNQWNVTADQLCQDADECALNTDTCDTNAVCANTVGSYTCTCNAGYSGSGTTCSDVDECVLNTDTCDIKAVCANTVGSYTCTCNAGYSGDGNSCSDVDECALGTDTCGTDAVCANTVGSFTCNCGAGYSDNGTLCIDVDECALNTDTCDTNAVCANTLGSYTCTCNAGYSGDGNSCSDVDECALNTDTCDTNAVCANTVGSYTCTCNAGYSGDGNSCSASCPLLDNGTILNPSCNKQHSELCSYSCPAGYTVMYDQIQCGTDSQWNVATDQLCKQCLLPHGPLQPVFSQNVPVLLNGIISVDCDQCDLFENVTYVWMLADVQNLTSGDTSCLQYEAAYVSTETGNTADLSCNSINCTALLNGTSERKLGLVVTVYAENKLSNIKAVSSIYTEVFVRDLPIVEEDLLCSLNPEVGGHAVITDFYLNCSSLHKRYELVGDAMDFYTNNPRKFRKEITVETETEAVLIDNFLEPVSRAFVLPAGNITVKITVFEGDHVIMSQTIQLQVLVFDIKDMTMEDFESTLDTADNGFSVVYSTACCIRRTLATMGTNQKLDDMRIKLLSKLTELNYTNSPDEVTSTSTVFDIIMENNDWIDNSSHISSAVDHYQQVSKALGELDEDVSLKLLATDVVKSVSILLDQLIDEHAQANLSVSISHEKSTMTHNLLKSLDVAMEVSLPSLVQTETPHILYTDESTTCMVHKANGSTIKGAKLVVEAQDSVGADTMFQFPDVPVVNDTNEIGIQMIYHRKNPYVWINSTVEVTEPVLTVTLKDNNNQELAAGNLGEPIKYLTHRISNVSGTSHVNISYTRTGDTLTAGAGSQMLVVNFTMEKGETKLLDITLPENISSVWMFGQALTPPDYTTVVNRGFAYPQNWREMQAFYGFENVLNLLENKTSSYELYIPASDEYFSVNQSYYVMYFGITLKFGDDVVTSELRMLDVMCGNVSAEDGENEECDGELQLSFGVQLDGLMCVFWNDASLDWSTNGCEAHPGTDPKQLECWCYHLTSFSAKFSVGDFLASPVLVNFEPPILFSPFTNNPVLVTAVCAVWLMYFLLLCWARVLDRQDSKKIGVVICVDNQPSETYMYLVCVLTGWWPEAGTTANVYMDIKGVHGSSFKKQLSTDARLCFQSGNEDWFLFSTKESLGSLESVSICHDNQGNSPHWYLNHVSVTDVQTMTTWNFICDDWLAVDRGRLQQKATTIKAITEAEMASKQKYNFMLTTSRYMRESNLWISVWSNHRGSSSFTCVQRLTCLLSLVLTMMLSNMMLYGLPLDIPTKEIQDNGFSFSWRQFGIGIASSLMVCPLNLIIHQLFTQVKQRPANQARSIIQSSDTNQARTTIQSSDSRTEEKKSYHILDERDVLKQNTQVIGTFSDDRSMLINPESKIRLKTQDNTKAITIDAQQRHKQSIEYDTGCPMSPLAQSGLSESSGPDDSVHQIPNHETKLHSNTDSLHTELPDNKIHPNIHHDLFPSGRFENDLLQEIFSKSTNESIKDREAERAVEHIKTTSRNLLWAALEASKKRKSRNTKTRSLRPNDFYHSIPGRKEQSTAIIVSANPSPQRYLPPSTLPKDSSTDGLPKDSSTIDSLQICSSPHGLSNSSSTSDGLPNGSSTSADLPNVSSFSALFCDGSPKSFVQSDTSPHGSSPLDSSADSSPISVDLHYGSLQYEYPLTDLPSTHSLQMHSRSNRNQVPVCSFRSNDLNRCTKADSLTESFPSGDDSQYPLSTDVSPKPISPNNNVVNTLSLAENLQTYDGIPRSSLTYDGIPKRSTTHHVISKSSSRSDRIAKSDGKPKSSSTSDDESLPNSLPLCDVIPYSSIVPTDSPNHSSSLGISPNSSSASNDDLRCGSRPSLLHSSSFTPGLSHPIHSSSNSSSACDELHNCLSPYQFDSLTNGCLQYKSLPPRISTYDDGLPKCSSLPMNAPSPCSKHETSSSDHNLSPPDPSTPCEDIENYSPSSDREPNGSLLFEGLPYPSSQNPLSPYEVIASYSSTSDCDRGPASTQPFDCLPKWSSQQPRKRETSSSSLDSLPNQSTYVGILQKHPSPYECKASYSSTSDSDCGPNSSVPHQSLLNPSSPNEGLKRNLLLHETIANYSSTSDSSKVISALSEGIPDQFSSHEDIAAIFSGPNREDVQDSSRLSEGLSKSSSNHGIPKQSSALYENVHKSSHSSNCGLPHLFIPGNRLVNPSSPHERSSQEDIVDYSPSSHTDRMSNRSQSLDCITNTLPLIDGLPIYPPPSHVARNSNMVIELDQDTSSVAVSNSSSTMVIEINQDERNWKISDRNQNNSGKNWSTPNTNKDTPNTNKDTPNTNKDTSTRIVNASSKNGDMMSIRKPVTNLNTSAVNWNSTSGTGKTSVNHTSKKNLIDINGHSEKEAIHKGLVNPSSPHERSSQEDIVDYSPSSHTDRMSNRSQSLDCITNTLPLIDGLPIYPPPSHVARNSNMVIELDQDTSSVAVSNSSSTMVIEINQDERNWKISDRNQNNSGKNWSTPNTNKDTPNTNKDTPNTNKDTSTRIVNASSKNGDMMSIRKPVTNLNTSAVNWNSTSGTGKTSVNHTSKKNLIDINGHSEKEAIHKGFPRWFIYIAWLFVIVTCLVSSFCVMLYGLRYGHTRSMEWIVSFATSCLHNALVEQPLKAIGMAAVLILILGRPVKLDPCGPITVGPEKDEGYNSEANINNHNIRPGPIIHSHPVNLNVKISWLKETFFREWVLYILYLTVLLFLVHRQNNHQISYMNSQTVYKIFVNPAGRPSLLNVTSPAEFYTYMLETFVPTAESLSIYQRHEASITSNHYMLGQYRIRQIRVKPGVCLSFIPHNLTRKCVTEYPSGNEDTKRYGESWSNITVDQSTGPWAYHKPADSHTSSHSGTYGTYPDGGYMIFLKHNASDKVFKLNKQGWIDDLTRALFVECTIYNPNIDMLTTVVLIVEMTPIGKMHPKYEILSRKLQHYSSSFQPIITFCEGLFVCLNVFFIHNEFKKLNRLGKRAYFSDMWNFVDILQSILSFIIVGLFIKRSLTIENALSELSENFNNKYINFYEMFYWNYVFECFIALLVTIVVTKSIKLLHFHSKTRLIMLTLRKVGPELTCFLVIFIIIIMAYVLCSVLVFGRVLGMYRNIQRSLYTNIGTLLGSNIGLEMKAVSYLFGPVYLMSFLMIVSFVLMKLCVTIINTGRTIAKFEISGEDM